MKNFFLKLLYLNVYLFSASFLAVINGIFFGFGGYKGNEIFEFFFQPALISGKLIILCSPFYFYLFYLRVKGVSFKKYEVITIDISLLVVVLAFLGAFLAYSLGQGMSNIH